MWPPMVTAAKEKLMSSAPTSTPGGRTLTLTDGNEVPVLALGVWQVPDGRECERSVDWALEAGYRHIDTAQGYGNERSVGRAVRASGLPRDEIFVTTKFNPSAHDPEVEIQRSLERLEMEFVDLYIVHWPQGGPTWAWDGMQGSQRNGYARSIGVSNFSAEDMDAVFGVADVPPVVNQVQFSPFEFRRSLQQSCAARGGDPRGLQSAGHRQPPERPYRDRNRRSAGSKSRSGVDPLVHPTRLDRAAQVDASGTYPAERAGLRF